jgi:hypothetical protein
MMRKASRRPSGGRSRSGAADLQSAEGLRQTINEIEDKVLVKLRTLEDTRDVTLKTGLADPAAAIGLNG